SRSLGLIKTEDKNAALLSIACALEEQAPGILEANREDMDGAKRSGMNLQLQDRLRLTEDRIKAMAEGVRQVAGLEDPVGRIMDEWARPNGLLIRKVSVPMGVIAMIYEARPNVTVDAAVLALKAGSGIILRGSGSALETNKKLVRVMKDALEGTVIDPGCMELIEEKSHDAVNQLMGLTEYLDLIIPRGGADLIRNVVQNSRVPVLETGVGNCHVFVDETADPEMAGKIILNAKTQRPSVCNACESLLIHEGWLPNAKDVLEKLIRAGVKIHADQRIRELVPEADPATDDDWGSEYLGLEISVKTVGSLDEAIEHINRYGTHHTECIVTEDAEDAERFLKEVDAAAVNWNASTRFTDGFEFGFGAEIGISTQKMHARGPLGLKEITSYKYMVKGNGQVRG
ncbi:MAG: glutamate-5-semialdehyde dehydrogenase, partial [Firmicutes bacterium]|nr:glutamate-5-semialdehyde dehydrogenase [Bacillota bacterium]